MQVNQCDRCGKIYDPEEIGHDTKFKLFDYALSEVDSEDWDLCPECAEEFDEWVQNITRIENLKSKSKYQVGDVVTVARSKQIPDMKYYGMSGMILKLLDSGEYFVVFKDADPTIFQDEDLMKDERYKSALELFGFQ